MIVEFSMPSTPPPMKSQALYENPGRSQRLAATTDRLNYMQRGWVVHSIRRAEETCQNNHKAYQQRPPQLRGPCRAIPSHHQHTIRRGWRCRFAPPPLQPLNRCVIAYGAWPPPLSLLRSDSAAAVTASGIDSSGVDSSGVDRIAQSPSSPVRSLVAPSSSGPRVAP